MEAEEEQAERREAGDRERAPATNREAEARHRRAVAEEDDSDDRPERDGGSLAGEAADPEREEEAGRRERQARPIRCERAAHGEQREEDLRHRDELEAVRPSLRPPSVPPTTRASTVIATADGSVKPSQAAAAPGRPAWWAPIAMPSWLDIGPGNRFVTATSSENSSSRIQRRRSTYSSRK